MSNTNQQAGAAGSAVAQPERLASAPGKDGKGSLEKTYSQPDVDKLQAEIDRLTAENKRLDDGRRGIQTKLTKLEKEHRELQGELETANSLNTSLEATLKENFTEESLRNAVREHAAAVAKHGREVSKFEKDKEETEALWAERENQTLKPIREKLATDYGCPIDLLDGITDPEQLEVTAIKNRTKLPETKAPEGSNDNKDNGNGGAPDPAKGNLPLMPGAGGGASLHDMTPDQRVAYGLKQARNKIN